MTTINAADGTTLELTDWPCTAAARGSVLLVHDRVWPRLVQFIADGGQQVRLLAPRWATPSLLLWAGSDRCALPRGSTEFAAAAPKAVVQSRMFERLAHEIFNEPEKAEVTAELLRWLARQPFAGH